MNHPLVRLSDFDLKTIKELFLFHFHDGDRLWLFGSRTDASKRGGDIDLYIETNICDGNEVIEARLNFLVDLDKKIGEQKIDVLIKFNNYELPIYEKARAEGVRLV